VGRKGQVVRLEARMVKWTAYCDTCEQLIYYRYAYVDKDTMKVYCHGSCAEKAFVGHKFVYSKHDSFA
jgi:hypothetical protein